MNFAWQIPKKILLTSASLLLLCQFAIRQTQGFTIASIRSQRPARLEWQLSFPSEEDQKEILSALSQSYFYLGAGAQSFVFSSQDDKYVLKFLKQRRYAMPLWLKWIRLPFLDRYRKKKELSRENNLKHDFSSYKLAYEQFKEPSQLLFIQLNRSSSLNITLNLQDKIGIWHQLSSDEVEFVLQRKAQLIQPTIDALVREEKYEEVRALFAKIIGFTLMRFKMGFADKDPNIDTNLGLIDGKIIKIDVGRLSVNDRCKERACYEPGLIRVSEPFRNWLKKYHPYLLSSFDTELFKALK